MRAYLDLIRLPNIFTAIADVLAGYLYTGGGTSGWMALVRLAAASACLYGGGVVLNDICDVERDRRERPDRPIPSGRTSIRGAGVLAGILLALGPVLAATVSTRAAVTAVALLVSIILYDRVFKELAVAPALMGLCRALNLFLGMTWVATSWTVAVMVPIALVWLYIASVTHFARGEADVSRRWQLGAGVIGACVAVGGLARLYAVVVAAHVEYLWLVGGLLIFLGYRGIRAAHHPEPANVQGMVRLFILSLVAFDASLAWAGRGPMAALCVAGLLVPTILLGRRLRVT